MENTNNTENNGDNKTISITVDKRLLVIIAGVVAAILLLLIIIYATNPEHKINKYLSLGEKYLSEQNYEEAIAQFNKVLEIDPRNENAEEYIVDAYKSWASAEEKNISYEQAATARAADEDNRSGKIKITCVHCGYEIYVTSKEADVGKIICPNCGEDAKNKKKESNQEAASGIADIEYKAERADMQKLVDAYLGSF